MKKTTRNTSKRSNSGRSSTGNKGTSSRTVKAAGGRKTAVKASKGATKKSAAKKATAPKKAAPKKAAPKKALAKKAAPKKSSARIAPKKAAPKKAASRRAMPARLPHEDLEKVMKDLLKDIYYAEKQLFKALNKLSRGASNQELKMAFDTHREETGEQIEKLEQVFEILGMRAQGKKCPAMDGLIEEGSEAIEEYDKGPARDAAMIVAAQKAEHYEISGYGSLKTFAETLGYDECAQIFEEIETQESDTDSKLSDIAKTVNKEAMLSAEEEPDNDLEDEDGEGMDEDMEEDDNAAISKVTKAAADEDMDEDEDQDFDDEEDEEA